MKYLTLALALLVTLPLLSQKTNVSGVVTEASTGQPVPFAKVFFKNTKTGTVTDLDGKYKLSSYYVSDSLVIRASGYANKTVFVKRDITQEINIELGPVTQIINEVVIRAPDEKPSTTLLKRVIKNKPINNKMKLESYEYDVYNKIQLDLNNLGKDFKKKKIVKDLKVIAKYLDSLNGKQILPVILSESLSHYYYKKNPKKKKEVVSASHITGVKNLKLNQFLGDMYQDINVYENYIAIFDKSFISPISDFGLSFYTYFLKDSMYIDNQWCYLLTFTPKRKGGLTFTGKMWVNDSSYAVKEWTASVSKAANVNFVNGFLLEQKFDEVKPEVWMLTHDNLIVDLQLYRKSKLLGFFGRKLSIRSNFIINQPRSDAFYNTNDVVVIKDSVGLRDDEYWEKHRPKPLNIQEKGIDNMIDSLNEVPLFNFFKDLTYLATTGFYPSGPLEIGNIRTLISYNEVEGLRNQLQLRTSNEFSKIIELRGRVAYGYRDQEFKYGGGIRVNVTPKKRGMLDIYYDYDVQQLGLGVGAEGIDNAFGSLLRIRPITQLTMVEKMGMSFEKDLGRSFIITAAGELRELTALGTTKFRIPSLGNSFYSIPKIRTFETSLNVRIAKGEKFIAGTFDRVSLGSKFPILNIKGTLGIKGVLGSDYEYQKVELSLSHSPRLGIMGILDYKIYGGIYFGKTAYPFLEIHPGSQSYWLHSSSHNLMDYYEFISDRYVGASFEHHFNGLLFDLVPLVRKLKWRLVLTGKGVWGTISDKQKSVMTLPIITKDFGTIPYVEGAIGIENIFKFFRVDLVWRITHQIPNRSPLGIRGKFSIRF